MLWKLLHERISGRSKELSSMILVSFKRKFVYFSCTKIINSFADNASSMEMTQSADNDNNVVPVEPEGERCYSSKKVAYYAWIWEHCRTFFVFAVRWGAKICNPQGKQVQTAVVRELQARIGFQLLASQRSILTSHPVSSRKKISPARSEVSKLRPADIS